jgi:hypothetical protein
MIIKNIADICNTLQDLSKNSSFSENIFGIVNYAIKNPDTKMCEVTVNDDIFVSKQDIDKLIKALTDYGFKVHSNFPTKNPDSFAVSWAKLDYNNESIDKMEEINKLAENNKKKIIGELVEKNKEKCNSAIYKLAQIGITKYKYKFYKNILETVNTVHYDNKEIEGINRQILDMFNNTIRREVIEKLSDYYTQNGYTTNIEVNANNDILEINWDKEE